MSKIRDKYRDMENSNNLILASDAVSYFQENENSFLYTSRKYRDFIIKKKKPGERNMFDVGRFENCESEIAKLRSKSYNIREKLFSMRTEDRVITNRRIARYLGVKDQAISEWNINLDRVLTIGRYLDKLEYFTNKKKEYR